MRLQVKIGLAAMSVCLGAGAQTVCTTQAKMTPTVRQSVADAAMTLASAIKSDRATQIQGLAVAGLAGNFAQVQYTVQNVSALLQGDSMRVSQVYLLDASTLKQGDDANFTCALTGSTSEVDFSISGLAAGVYSFAMVEAEGGSRPWLLSFLLQQGGGTWKMAGLYEHPRAAAGKDGLTYWKTARQQKATQPWLAWLSYGEADTLLAPAPFASSTNLDNLRTERRQAAPGALADGISSDEPLVVKTADGKDVKITSLSTDTTTDGATLRLVVRYAAVGDAPVPDTAAVRALLAAHPEIRQGFGAVLVFGDAPGKDPSVLSAKMSEIPS